MVAVRTQRNRLEHKVTGTEQESSPAIGRLLTVPEVAEILRIKPKTFYDWTRAGRGPKCIRVGKQRRYRPEDVQAYIAANEDVA
jgi:excisionase family DNA binding protein